MFKKQHASKYTPQNAQPDHHRTKPTKTEQ